MANPAEIQSFNSKSGQIQVGKWYNVNLQQHGGPKRQVEVKITKHIEAKRKVELKIIGHTPNGVRSTYQLTYEQIKKLRFSETIRLK